MRCSLSEHQQDNYCQELFKLPIFQYFLVTISNMKSWTVPTWVFGREWKKGKVSSKVGGNGGNDGGIME